MLDEAPALLCLVLLASSLLCLDTWRAEAVPEETCTGQALVTTATNPLSHCVQPGGEDNKFSLSCVLSIWGACPWECREWRLEHSADNSKVMGSIPGCTFTQSWVWWSLCLFQHRTFWDSISLILLHYPWFLSLLTSSQRCVSLSTGAPHSVPAVVAQGQCKSWHWGGNMIPLEFHLGSCAPHAGWCWQCFWYPEIPTGFFYPLEEVLAWCSWSCQPWHELQAAIDPRLSFPNSDSSPMHLTVALHRQTCQYQSHSPQKLQ